MARLVIFDDNVRAVELPQRQILIGRSKKNDVPINDRLLSRKHCSIVPLAGGYRLLDLKSSNGTYLNGERIEKVDLTSDDIVEIGQTVMVFLEDGVWNRGEALARLRNPIKAQELIGRIKRHQRAEDDAARIPIGKVSPRTAQGSGKSRKLRRVKRPAAAGDPLARPGLIEAVEDFVVHRAVLILLKSSPGLRRAVAEVLREVLGPGAESAALDLRSRVRHGLRRRLSRSGSQAQASREEQGKPEGARPAEEEGKRPETRTDAGGHETAISGEAERRGDGDGAER